MIQNMLELLQLTKLYDLHKYREIYKSKNGKNEVIFDHFLGLSPYIEVESSTEIELKKTMKKLNLVDEPTFTAKDLYFNMYGITKDRPDIELTFTNANKVLIKYITKNKKQFTTLLKQQKSKFI